MSEDRIEKKKKYMEALAYGLLLQECKRSKESEGQLTKKNNKQ